VSLICSIAIVYFLLDVNHHSEKEILKKNEQLEKANTELDRFVYGASHDLKAPLSSLLGLIEIAKIDQKEISHYLLLMQDRIHNMEGFISDIISYSRNSGMEVVNQTESLKKIAIEIVDGLMFADHARRIHIENKIAASINVHTDLPRLKVVLTNLVSNALKYCDERKENSFIRIEASQNEHATVISVTDNGIGIGDQHHDKIFNMFYRASEKSKGSGLGLYIVKETLLKINGSIKVESALGIGTTFTVTLQS
jgi:signal transduction histidine kinase